MRHARRLVLAMCVLGAMTGLLLSPAGAVPGTPLRSTISVPSQRPTAPEADTVDAVVVKSWSGCGSASVIWETLNANWSSYGSIPISIDYSDPALCSGTVTYDALVASGADVVIISDPAGGGHHFKPAEIKAISDYANLGHNVIGTFLTFFWRSTDNTRLGRMFGFPSHQTYLAQRQHVTPSYDIHAPTNPLFRNLPDPYVSSGYASSQIPASGVWDAAAFNKADGKARTADARAAISIYQANTYAAIYISTMPEYGGGTQDQQFFYNAIIYPQIG